MSTSSAKRVLVADAALQVARARLDDRRAAAEALARKQEVGAAAASEVRESLRELFEAEMAVSKAEYEISSLNAEVER